MNVLLVAATPFEIAPALAWLESNFSRPTERVFEKGGLIVQPLVTGVGIAATAFHLGSFYAHQKPDWAINAGIAGGFDVQLKMGDVVQVGTERFGDLGVEEADGRFTDLSELGFEQSTLPLFPMHNPQTHIPNLPVVHGLTVNKVHGTAESIQKIKEKYPNVQVESMEGAAFFYASLQMSIPFAEIRAISNRVEPRNRNAWEIPLAINNLNMVLIEMLEGLAAI